MYYVIDLETSSRVTGISFSSEDEACEWINSTGIECPPCKYSIEYDGNV